jgi:prepilin-type N-terminal cleavage/methylation domain-containing protein
MILKVLIPNLSKTDKSIKGFTLMELIIGLSIMTIIGSLAMNMLIHASNSFNQDQKSINSSQNLSAILEIIGNDIRQSGENINDGFFPVIEFAENTDSGSMPSSSKVTVRRALTSRLTLCDPAFTPTATSIIVADNQASVIGQSANCDIGTATSPLSIYRVSPAIVPPATLPPATTYVPTIPVTPIPTTPATFALKLPVELRKVRDYRCNTDPNTNYDSAANVGTDFCSLVPTAKLRIAVSSSDGQLLIFNQTNEVANATADTSVKAIGDTTSTKRYSISVNRTFATGNAAAVPPIPPDPAIASNIKNSAGTISYNIGDPIYVIEERVYTLTNDGSFNVSVNGAPPQTLIKKITNFRVSARVYTNTLDRVINPSPTPALDICTVPTGTTFLAQPAAPDVNNPQYLCKFNYFTGVTSSDKANWKTLAGVKVELQAKYDGTGKASESSTNAGDKKQVATDKEKLSVAAEYFPRNVLSK